MLLRIFTWLELFGDHKSATRTKIIALLFTGSVMLFWYILNVHSGSNTVFGLTILFFILGILQLTAAEVVLRNKRNGTKITHEDFREAWKTHGIWGALMFILMSVFSWSIPSIVLIAYLLGTYL